MKTGRGAYDPEFASRVLADAILCGSDVQAARRHAVSERTVQRYRKRQEDDEKLAALVAKKVVAAERSWHRVRNRGLSAVVNRIIELSSTEQDLDKLTRAATALGELDISEKVLSGSRSPADHLEGEASAAPSGGSETEVAGEGDDDPGGT